MANIAVLGLWHQASVLAACFADMGHRVRGAGGDAGSVGELNAGRPPVREPKLPAMMRRNLRAGRLMYTTNYADALAGAEYVFLAVDTPVDAGDHPDLTPVLEEARRAAHAMSGDMILCVTAQVPVGTCAVIQDLVERHRPGACDVVYVPEFLRLGRAVDTFRKADRFVIGAGGPATAKRVAALFAPLRRPIVVMSVRSAEMTKHASNAYLAASISFVNEIADLCDELGADIRDVVRGMRLDRRIGPYAFLTPGLGFAGGTLGREIRTLQQLAERHAGRTPLMDAVMAVNRGRVRVVRDRLARAYGSLDGLRVGLLGLTYKSGTSTLRRSIALEIATGLVEEKVDVRVFDPYANLAEVRPVPGLSVSEDGYAAAEVADALILLTDWEGWRRLDFARIKQCMRRPLVIDIPNLLDPQEMRALGFAYSGIGRGLRFAPEGVDRERSVQLQAMGEARRDAEG
jgi:UDPglucose 6-dehydrogenase